MQLFILNEKNYTKNIVMNSYKVQSEPETETWEDATYRTHADLKRWRVKGSFKMYFETIEDFREFLTELENMRGTDNYTEATLYDNYKMQQHESRYSFKLALTNDLPYYGYKKHDGYEVQVEEQ